MDWVWLFPSMLPMIFQMICLFVTVIPDDKLTDISYVKKSQRES